MVKFQFKGLLAPVFTPFSNDLKTINYDVIEKYGQYLKTKGVHGILVNGTVGEGTTLRIEERKRLAEEWLKVARKNGLIMLLAIGGVGIADVYDLAEHAETIGVDCIVLLPDLYYNPRVEEDLVEYIKDVAKYSPTRPILYYHVPQYTNVRLNLVRFHNLVLRSVNNYSGIYYRDTNIELVEDLLKFGAHLILSTDTILVGALALGVDAISSITLNVYPENIVEIYELILNNKLHEARELNNKLYLRIRDIVTDPTIDWVELFKVEFNKRIDIKIGHVRRPQITFNLNRNL